MTPVNLPTIIFTKYIYIILPRWHHSCGDKILYTLSSFYIRNSHYFLQWKISPHFFFSFFPFLLQIAFDIRRDPFIVNTCVWWKGISHARMLLHSSPLGASFALWIRWGSFSCEGLRRTLLTRTTGRLASWAVCLSLTPFDSWLSFLFVCCCSSRSVSLCLLLSVSLTVSFHFFSLSIAFTLCIQSPSALGTPPLSLYLSRSQSIYLCLSFVYLSNSPEKDE